MMSNRSVLNKGAFTENTKSQKSWKVSLKVTLWTEVRCPHAEQYFPRTGVSQLWQYVFESLKINQPCLRFA